MDATARFSGRADDYAKKRPSYPAAALDELRAAAEATRLDREGLASRLRSSSYAPKASDPHHDATFAELGALFDAHVEPDGHVTTTYETVMVLGHVC